MSLKIVRDQTPEITKKEFSVPPKEGEEKLSVILHYQKIDFWGKIGALTQWRKGDDLSTARKILESLIVDWEGVEEEDGTPVPYSVENFALMLDAYPELFPVICEDLEARMGEFISSPEQRKKSGGSSNPSNLAKSN